MNVVFLSLGGNTGERLENLNAAVRELEKYCGSIEKKSSVYETEAWGFVSEKKYLNQVVKLETKLNAQELLKKSLSIEKKLGRKRGEAKYVDRCLDIDILFFNREIIDTTDLQVPHPRLHERKFVLTPLNEIESGFVHPQLKKNIRTLLKNCKDKLGVEKYETKKSIKYICIEGNIGSGKTTLAKALVKKWKSEFLPEQFEENLLLPLFYGNPKLYAFPVEYNFLISRYEQILLRFQNAGGFVVSDFSIYKCLWFAKINLPKKEYKLFKKHFDAFADLLPKPDLIVYLNTSVANLKKNILKRGRPYEKNIKSAYLQAIEKEYKKGLNQFDTKNTLIIDIENYNSKPENAAIKRIENYLKENFG